MTETRRQALKWLGAIGATCAFPFPGDELYGQHVHLPATGAAPPGPFVPAFFTAAEYATVSHLADVIIPPTDTPGAVSAGVPEYIDLVVALNAVHQPLARAGVAWLNRQASETYDRPWVSLDQAQSAAILQPLSDAVDERLRRTQQSRFRTGPDGRKVYYAPTTDTSPPQRPGVVALPAKAPAVQDSDMPEQFFRLMKNLTADGYYSSRAGLIEELGYKGNTALAAFPACSIPEH